MTSPSHTPKIGMIVLKTDETVEHESRFYLHDIEARLLTTRIEVSDTINADTLQAMRGQIQNALALFPEQYDFDVIAYACTSAATVIGEQTVSQDICRHVKTTHTTNPLTAAKAALAHLGARRIAYLAPYVSDVAQAMQDVFKHAGFTIAATDSFNINSDRAVAALSPQQIASAIAQFSGDDIDAVFVSCTNLQCADIIAPTEQQLGKPVISSNQALLWHTMQLANIPLPVNKAYGRLFNQ